MSDKVTDALDAYPTLLANHGDEMKTQVKYWADHNAEAAKSSIKLGGHLHSKDQKTQRQAVRACLLAAQALGIVNSIGVDALKNRILDKSVDQLKAELKGYTAFLMEQLPAHSIVFGWSFAAGQANSFKLPCINARTIAIVFLENAKADLVTIKQSNQSTDTFQDYFGDFNKVRFAIVYSRICAMLQSLRSGTLWLYYRGKNIAARNDGMTDWPWVVGEIGGLARGDYMGASIVPKQRLEFPMSASHHGMQSEFDMHVKFGSGSEDKSNQDLAKTLVHELSHYVGGTRDVKLPLLAYYSAKQLEKVSISDQVNMMGHYITKSDSKPISRNEFNDRTGKLDKLPQDYQRTGKPPLGRRGVLDSYGDDICQNLATNFPEKAVENADNYAFYCASV